MNNEYFTLLSLYNVCMDNKTDKSFAVSCSDNQNFFTTTYGHRFQYISQDALHREALEIYDAAGRRTFSLYDIDHYIIIRNKWQNQIKIIAQNKNIILIDFNFF